MPDDPTVHRVGRGTSHGMPEPPAGSPAPRDDEPPERLRDGEEEMPRVRFTVRRALLFALFIGLVLAALYFVLPRLTGLRDTWDRLDEGAPGWLALAFVLEILSFTGYVILFRTVYRRGGYDRLDWRASYEITMAGVVATRLFAAAGAGGIALTAWAVRRAGMPRRIVACRTVAFLGLLYAVYVLALVLCGVGLRVGVLPGRHPFAVTIVPAIFGAAAIAVGALICLLPRDVERRLQRSSSDHGRLGRLAARAATVPASAASGLRTGIDILREREPGLLGAVMWWGFDIATLWASFEAFGHAPSIPVTIMAYFVGMLANVLPLPGGIGGVDGGMIGAFIAFGVSGGLAVVAVLVYRAFSFWLPILPGAVAYLQLRRRVARWRAEPAAVA